MFVALTWVVLVLEAFSRLITIDGDEMFIWIFISVSSDLDERTEIEILDKFDHFIIIVEIQLLSLLETMKL